MRRALIGTVVLLALAALQLMSGSVGVAARLDADTDPPTLTLPGNMTVEATGPAGAVATFTASATDLVDGVVPVNCAPTSGATFPLGSTTVSCSASDAAANTASGSFTVTVSDTTAPSLHLPASMTVEATGSSGASVPFTATATDLVNGSVSVACTPASGATFALGTTTVSCSAADAAGNRATGSFTVTVSDTTAPALHLPADMTVPATGPSGAAVTFTATATDLVDGSVVPTCAPASGSTFALGTTTVTCSARDAAGHSASGSFTVTVTNTTPPTLHVPADMTVEATGSSGAAVTFTATATDLTGAAVTPICAPASGATFPLGTTTVSCSATDTAGNRATGSFSVTVSDRTAPTLHLPANMTVEATGSSGAAVTFTATATDLVSGSVSVACTPASGATFPLGTTTVSCSATDTAGNRVTGSFSVTVSDRTAPTLQLPANMTVEATGSSGAAVTFTATATDLVNGSVSVACTPASGATFPLGTTTVSCSAADAAGNRATGSFTVTVSDTTPPTLQLPANKTVEADGPTGSKVTFEVSGSDLGEALLPSKITCAPVSGSLFPLGTTTVTCKTTADPGGNVGQGSFDIVVVDTTQPILAVPPDSTVYATTDAGIPASADAVARLLVAAGAVDVVDPHPVITNDAPAVFVRGTTVVKFTAKDAKGNVATRSLRITVIDRPATGGGGGGGAPTAPKETKAIDTTPPANAASFVAKAGAGSVQLAWKLPTDADFDHVEVFRSGERTTAAPIEIRVYRGKGTSFVDRGLTAGTRYRYVIASFDTTGNRSAGAIAVATPKAVMLVAPASGTKVSRAPVLRWKAYRGAVYYNVQIFRGTTKVLSAWPTTTSLQLTLTWRYKGKAYRLDPGAYHWYVWPGIGARATGTYGPVLGDSTFTVLKGVKK